MLESLLPTETTENRPKTLIIAFLLPGFNCLPSLRMCANKHARCHTTKIILFSEIAVQSK